MTDDARGRGEATVDPYGEVETLRKIAYELESAHLSGRIVVPLGSISLDTINAAMALEAALRDRDRRIAELEARPAIVTSSYCEFCGEPRTCPCGAAFVAAAMPFCEHAVISETRRRVESWPSRETLYDRMMMAYRAMLEAEQKGADRG